MSTTDRQGWVGVIVINEAAVLVLEIDCQVSVTPFVLSVSLTGLDLGPRAFLSAT